MPTTVFHYPESYTPPPVALKEGQVFYLGEMELEGRETAAGLYFRDTRYLSQLRWRIEGQPLTTLSSNVLPGARAHVDLTNPDISCGDVKVVARSIHVLATTVVSQHLYQRLRLTSFLSEPVTVALTLRLNADFKDIFELRGIGRHEHGTLNPPSTTHEGATFSYVGRDGLAMSTRVVWQPAPKEVRHASGGSVEATFLVELKPGAKAYLAVRISPVEGEASPGPAPDDGFSREFAVAAYHQAQSYHHWERSCTKIDSDNPVYDAAMRQAVRDLRTLTTDYPGEGSIVDAGIPWYVAPFGRDSMITGIESLLLTEEVLTDALRFLAHHQGRTDDAWRDEEPGKMLHELRRGEMARCGEVPHTPYYGSVDGTLWWVIALGEAFRHTGNRGLIEELADPLKLALEWAVRYGDLDGDHLLEYRRRSPMGLDNQGWKDSFDSIQDGEGHVLTGAIALVEVQGYAYRALRDGARLLRVLGMTQLAQRREGDAAALRQAFLAKFWDPKTGRIALALDGEKRPAWSRASNAGHLLFTDILARGDARRVAHDMFSRSMYSGFGVRTLDRKEDYFNPLSYHNGSVWPHDNAIIAWGLRHLGRIDLVRDIARSLFAASENFAYGRLPELYGGLHRRPSAGPVRYPVACDPQAWAVGAPPFLLKLMLGLEVRGHTVVVDRPVLPPWIDAVRLRDWRVAGGQLDVEFARHNGVTYANVLRCDGPVRVVIHPA